MIRFFLIFLISFSAFAMEQNEAEIIVAEGNRLFGEENFSEAIQTYEKALQFHPMFWSIPILLFYFIYDGVPLKNKKINNSIFFLILLGWFLNYLLKLFLF